MNTHTNRWTHGPAPSHAHPRSRTHERACTHTRALVHIALLSPLPHIIPHSQCAAQCSHFFTARNTCGRYQPATGGGGVGSDPQYATAGDTNGYLHVGEPDDASPPHPAAPGGVTNPSYGAGGNAAGGIYDELDSPLPPPPKKGERRGSARNETYAAAPPQNRSNNGGVYDTVGVLAVNHSSKPSSSKPPSVKRGLKPGANSDSQYATAKLAHPTYDDVDDKGC